ncbi:DUF1934 domain-containing protein [Flavonifractor sp. DFI.6.63]|uniref:DUF1934 domain-containing protein n=1 Tax=Lawsonibacter hominis TaxID=2763053 RepID=A0A8J6M5V7_9FIRM|nr:MULTISPECIES: DUF1934 domain-containing protein [Oscillospiraceae]MDU2195407.1 DUF1934 domain-containing protein [Clostridiales bacterium]MDY2977510.1 DUF1934 domain-containing protein [Oscillospiraceae bacterium]MBC5734207.1 DUF1934 domain-containing protein [Lawsonibacter hominis]MCI6398253.1 DUF1934 domain-containing protein [Lawsonibacter sp.]MCQ5030663.1 DUF1934 domain-containing protein [Flavonifractor sp. DFI.6.63]
MENNVIISIKGKQSYEDMEDETIELVTEGRLDPDGTEGYTLSYQESELTGLEGTLTTFQIEPERITLLRIGEVNSQMVFEQGRRHLSLYDTPYGSLSVGVSTRKMHAELGLSGGSIEIDYAIEIDHAVAGQNLFQINVREKRPILQQ